MLSNLTPDERTELASLMARAARLTTDKTMLENPQPHKQPATVRRYWVDPVTQSKLATVHLDRDKDPDATIDAACTLPSALLPGDRVIVFWQPPGLAIIDGTLEDRSLPVVPAIAARNFEPFAPAENGAVQFDYAEFVTAPAQLSQSEDRYTFLFGIPGIWSASAQAFYNTNELDQRVVIMLLTPTDSVELASTYDPSGTIGQASHHLANVAFAAQAGDRLALFRYGDSFTSGPGGDRLSCHFVSAYTPPPDVYTGGGG